MLDSKRRRAWIQIAAAMLLSNSLGKLFTPIVPQSTNQSISLFASKYTYMNIIYVNGRSPEKHRVQPSSEIGSSPLKGCEGNCRNGGKPTTGFMTRVTCRLNATNWSQLRNPTLSNRVRATFIFFYLLNATQLQQNSAKQRNHTTDCRADLAVDASVDGCMDAR